MTVWEILNIEPTQDKKAIRKAYAILSKQYHPEENPEKFQEIYQAYQQALQLIVSANKGEDIRREQTISGVASSDEEENKSSSLLDRLEKQEQEKKRKIWQDGPMDVLIELFSSAKTRNKQQKWQEFFLSDKFLEYQFNTVFVDSLIDYMQEQSYCKIDQLPNYFLTELAISYGVSYDLNGYIMEQEGVIGKVAWLLNQQSEVWRISRGVRILEIKDNYIRLLSFIDYLKLCNMLSDGYLNEYYEKQWGDQLLYYGKNCNLSWENNGAIPNNPALEIRHKSLIRLYTYFIKKHEISVCICMYMYETYEFKGLVNSSRKTLYGNLYQAILEKFPDIEELIEKKNQMADFIAKIFFEMSLILEKYNQPCWCGMKPYGLLTMGFVKNGVDDFKEEHKAVEKLLNLLDDVKIRFAKTWLEKLVFKWMTTESSPVLTRRLYEFYKDDAENPDVFELLEFLMVHYSYHQRMQEYVYNKPFIYEKTKVSDVQLANREFWLYYLEVCYRYRYLKISDKEEKNDFIHASYLNGDQKVLSAYMNRIYQPSMEWRKLFTGYNEKTEQIDQPVFIEARIKDTLVIKIEFHLHYVLYFANHMPILRPIFTFNELIDAVNGGQSELWFHLLLPITKIQDEERQEAYEKILRCLKNLPLYTASLSVIARCIANDNGDGADDDRASVIYRNFLDDGRFCYKLEITPKAVMVFRSTAFLWQRISLKETEQLSEMDMKEKISLGLKMLNDFKKPLPIRSDFSLLKGLSNRKKSEIILGALSKPQSYDLHNSNYFNHCLKSKVADMFFDAVGRYIAGSYVVLCIGEQERQRFKCIFYMNLGNFGIQPAQLGKYFARSYQFCVEDIEKKIKENFVLIGDFGWALNPPFPLALGESGTFYTHNATKFYKAADLAELFTMVLELDIVSGVEIYEGELTVSPVDQKLEY